ncbi:hypothetical protein [Paenibacillus gallinarum]|uniref:Uncharacterized protein n=1 Tax=Paenibacillus gallinarum TaxID=2762232 RepID=A0ABR8T1Q8_9BACL|nr:hypothetical protein [Paenibacillus gallinarum]MBD7969239.1 hypothetical protein [Paenibacillus gallinarum]
MKDSHLSKWERTRTKGKIKYIIFNGIIGWGVSTALIGTMLMTFVGTNQDFFHLLLLSLIAFPLAGILFGVSTWYWSESIYQKSINNKDN